MKAEARKQAESPPIEEALPKLTYADAPAGFGESVPVPILRFNGYVDGRGLSASGGIRRMEADAPLNQTRYLADYFPKVGLYRVVHFASGQTEGKTTYIESDAVKSWDFER